MADPMHIPERRRMLPAERAHLEQLARTMTGSPVHTLELFIAHSLRVLKLALAAAVAAWILIQLGWTIGSYLMAATKWLLVLGLALNAGLSIVLSRMFSNAVARMRERIEEDLERGEVEVRTYRARGAVAIRRGKDERGDSHLLELEDGSILYVNAVHTFEHTPGSFPCEVVEVVRAPVWADTVAVRSSGAALPVARTLPPAAPEAIARLGTVKILPGPMEAAEKLVTSPPVETSPTV